MKRTLLISLALIGLLAAAYSSWTGRSEVLASPATPEMTAVGSIVRLPILSATAVNTLDPIQSVEIAQYDLCNQIFEGLVSVDLKGNIAPGIATQWEHSQDFRIWTFHLRDAHFADDPAFLNGRGRKVNTEDVLYSLKRGLSPEQGSKGSFALSRAVVGAKEYSEGKSDDVSGLRSQKPGVVEIELISGDRFFPSALTVPSTYVVPREAVERYGTEFGRKPVGSGPFRLAQWKEGLSLTLLRNSNFGKGTGLQPPAALVDKVEFRFFRSEAQMVGAFAAGEIDLRPVVGADLATRSGRGWELNIKAANPTAKLVQPGWVLKLHLLAPQMGSNHPLGREGAPRRALGQILAKRLAEIDALRGIGKAQSQLMPANLVDSLVVMPPISDPERVLKASVSGRNIRIAYASSRINDTVVRLLEQILSDAGATPLLFPSTSINALFGSLAAVQPDLTLIYWSPYFPNASEFLTALLTTSIPVPNFTGFSFPRLDNLAAELRSGRGEMHSVLTDIQHILNSELPWVPLYLETPYCLVAKDIHDFVISPVSVTQLTKIRLK